MDGRQPNAPSGRRVTNASAPFAGPIPPESVGICSRRGSTATVVGNGGSWIVSTGNGGHGGMNARQRAIKRGFDVAVATVVLVGTMPLMALVALAVVIESPGSIFYRAERVGFRGRRLRMLKFRKMPPQAKGIGLTLHGDARLTRIGALMAKTRIDELPQFWHVLRGRDEPHRPAARVAGVRRPPRRGLRRDPDRAPGHRRAVAARLRRGGRDPPSRRPGRPLRRSGSSRRSARSTASTCARARWAWTRGSCSGRWPP